MEEKKPIGKDCNCLYFMDKLYIAQGLRTRIGYNNQQIRTLEDFDDESAKGLIVTYKKEIEDIREILRKVINTKEC